ncbi:MAG: DUF58 domain-containing protein [Methylobacter sp.]
MSIAPDIFRYRPARPAVGVFPGAHPGQMVGSGQLFKRHEPLIASPDPRRIDLRASVLDPFGGYRVRVYQQKSTLDVYLIADLSASMSFSGRLDKQRMLVDFLLSAASSAFSYSDNFSFIGCGRQLEQRWLVQGCRQMGRIQALANQLQNHVFAQGSESLSESARFLPAKPALVFLLSDFHFGADRLHSLMHTLSRHDVVPLVLWDSNEFLDLPQWGLVKYRDMENGSERTLFMRPALRRNIVQAYEQRRRRLQRTFRAFGAEPLFIDGHYQAAHVDHYFQQRAA